MRQEPARAAVRVLSLPHCVQCDATYRALDKRGIAYRVEDLGSMDEKVRAELRELGFLQAPVVLVTDGSGHTVEAWSGFRPDRIGQLAPAPVAPAIAPGAGPDAAPARLEALMGR